LIQTIICGGRFFIEIKVIEFFLSFTSPLFLCFGGIGVLNSGLHTCKAGPLLLEPPLIQQFLLKNLLLSPNKAAHNHNPRHSRGGNQKDHSSRPAQTKKKMLVLLVSRNKLSVETHTCALSCFQTHTLINNHLSVYNQQLFWLYTPLPPGDVC
jgi:hypothetical protein